eukprot:UN02345
MFQIHQNINTPCTILCCKGNFELERKILLRLYTGDESR